MQTHQQKRYSYHFIEHGFIEVYGLLMGGNLADNATKHIEDLIERWHDVSKIFVVYRDMHRQYVQVLIKEGRFLGFKPLGSSDMYVAIDKIRNDNRPTLQEMVTPISAYVAEPNTAETDLQPQVLHVVQGHLSTGALKKLILMAIDPMDAIDKARKIDASQWHESDGHR